VAHQIVAYELSVVNDIRDRTDKCSLWGRRKIRPLPDHISNRANQRGAPGTKPEEKRFAMNAFNAPRLVLMVSIPRLDRPMVRITRFRELASLRSWSSEIISSERATRYVASIPCRPGWSKSNWPDPLGRRL